MPPTKSKNEDGEHIAIRPIETRRIPVALLGQSPLILKRMSQKSAAELLLPRGPKNAAQKQSELKHDPAAEFAAAPYRFADDASETLLGIMSSAVKGAMMTAALDLPGAKKAQIGRLVYVENDLVPIWGIPKVFMSITRSADINRTPDVRTRAIVPTWAALVWVRFVVPLLTQTAVINLINAGGTTAGVGDWRPEKGKGSYGQFEVVTPTDPRFVAIRESGGRARQLAAMADPRPYDTETGELWSWFEDEIVARGKSGARGPSTLERANGQSTARAAAAAVGGGEDA